jgi:serine/threonine protein kinase
MRQQRELTADTIDSDGMTSPHLAGGMSLLSAPSGPAESGQRIGPYKVLQLIGEGGFGLVYMAEQLQPVRRIVALKIIKLGMDTKEVIGRFEIERQALAMMDHPNIAKVLDAGATETGRPYFVMELVKGVPITEYCDTHNLSTKERLVLFMLACQAVQHAHQKGIIHRDIKPSNVMIAMHDGKPVPKVIDFGIAKAIAQRLTDKTLVTEYHQLIGTPEYMSPEQAEMTGIDIDTRSDIYSLGVLLYELLTGTTPFDSKELRRGGCADVQRMIREVEPCKPSTRLSAMGERAAEIARRRQADARTLRKTLSGDLDWIAMKCLEKDRTRRYETANGLAMDVLRYLCDEAVTASPPSWKYRFGKFVHRNRRLVVSASLIALTLVLASVSTAMLAISESRARTRAEQQRDAAVLARTDLVLLLAMIDEPILGGSSKDHRPILRECLTTYQGFGTAVQKQEGAVLLALGKEEDEHGQKEVAANFYRQAIARLEPIAQRGVDQPVFGRTDAMSAVSQTGMSKWLTVGEMLDSAKLLLKQITGEP